MELDFLLDFLAQLAANNTTAWMADHRPAYQRARAACTELVRQVLAQAAATDPDLMGLTTADVMFRLHKNDRAHRDPEPYKRRMGAGLKLGGRHAPRAGYFLAIQPDGRSWLGAGTFHPTPAMLAAIRQEIHYNGAEFHRLRQAPPLMQYFPEGVATTGPQLTRPPRGYSADDPDLAWLRLKTYGVGRFYTDAEVLAPDFVAKVVAGIAAARPLVDFFNEALPIAERQ
ncbi:DUF2461 domain-containing protein [Hymenobacter sp. BT770]|uniref:DUF2461 domain-containing protein n=1 Tax=Hymenobacter sp. BT770 TaxID=2886942 RepID=UPI001D1112D6|nr:DUF2461 domain-containing protein [Hymenobacter sp. BT770]MCC3151996.1 DUF2461 domain-containing protein [Hymenobacter sp. BT770]MDO3417106.1 DUF2461 domain-containing protein [Hymenobacter sp. BT770]